MKVLTFSKSFPKGHPKAGEPTHFVQKILHSQTWPVHPITNIGWPPKHHTIRAGSRWKVGDMASLRIWSGLPYRSKQIEFAQVEVKKVWEIEIYQNDEYWIFTLNGKKLTWDDLNVDQFIEELAKNDGLTMPDFLNWFSIHPKKRENIFAGQIICWSDNINYTP